MRKKYRVFQVDAFTIEPFSEIPRVLCRTQMALTEEQMQAIARELNNSETAFVFQPTAADHDVHVRFFTPTKEVPICGHATVAAHYVLALITKGGCARAALVGELRFHLR